MTISLLETCRNLASSGIPLGNQSVLLKGVNDDVITMKSLVHRLLKMKVKPIIYISVILLKEVHT